MKEKISTKERKRETPIGNEKREIKKEKRDKNIETKTKREGKKELK